MGSIEIPTGFKLKESPIENLRPVKVRVIGAGFSGLYLGVRVPQRIQNVDFTIYEKNEGLGGTWWENRYPGCACDVPAHSYQYTFEPNPNWSEFYASSQEIREYLTHVAEKYGVTRFVKTSHKVTACTWNDSTKKWKVVGQNLATGETFEEDDIDFVISARGTLNEAVWPKVPGLKDFKGKLMHSSSWDERYVHRFCGHYSKMGPSLTARSYDFKNKKIGLIGGGSSGVQILPELQKLEGTTIHHLVRERVWIAAAFFDNTMIELGLDPKIMGFTEERQKNFVEDSEGYLKFRKVIEGFGSGFHQVTLKDSQMQADTVAMLREYMKEQLSKKPEIAEALTPNYAAGCRRMIPGPGYLNALVQDNVIFYSNQMAAVHPNGVELNNGETIDLDVVICATGFNTNCVPIFEVTGKNGQTLEKRFSPFAESYLSVAVDDFPNYFMMLGPNAMLGAGALTIVMEAEGDYIIKCIRKVQNEDYISMEPKKSRVKDFSDYCQAYFQRTIYTDSCRSWYKNGAKGGDRVIGLWPGSTTHALESLRRPRWEDFDYESIDDNKLRWLGNGWTECQTNGDRSFYLDPEFIDYPTAGFPENDPRHKKRPFSY